MYTCIVLHHHFKLTAELHDTALATEQQTDNDNDCDDYENIGEVVVSAYPALQSSSMSFARKEF
jgi:hypothetical protein